jgi:ligand-binding sensor domain-containing protein/signal transduction histidine kinase
MKPALTIVLALLLTVSRCPGQATGYSFSKLDTRDGLSNNLISAIYKDHQGFIWIGTQAGVNRYDGYTIKAFQHADQDSTSIENDNITGIYEGPGGKIWMSTYVGIDMYDPVTEKFDPHPDRFFRSAQLPFSNLPNCGLAAVLRSQDAFIFVYADSGIYVWNALHAASCIRPAPGGHLAAGGQLEASGHLATGDPVNAAARDKNGNLWIVHASGLLEQFDPVTHSVLYRSSVLPRENPNQFKYSMYIDHEGLLWLYAPGSISGVYQFDPGSHTLLHFSKNAGTPALTSDVVNGIVQDDSGLIWIGTDQGGVDLMDKRRSTVRCLLSGEEPGSLAQNTIAALYYDDLGIVWVGTYKKGLNFYHPDFTRFPLFRHLPGQPQSLPYNDVIRFAEDKAGNLWLGTNGGGLIRLDRKTNTFTTWQHKPGDVNSVAANVIVSLLFDRRGKLWIGYYQGGLDCFDGHRFIHSRHNDADTASLADDRANCLAEDRDGQLWIGTMDGLDRYDPGQKRFYHYYHQPFDSTNPTSVHTSYISAIREDAKGNLWIGTAYGLSVLQKATGRFVYYFHENSRLSENLVNDLFIDSTGLIWVATRRGLNVLMPGTDSFRVFLTKDGLPDNDILNILADKQGCLWASTPAGLSKIAVVRQAGNIGIHCVNYDETDGLQGRAFNENAAFSTSQGELIFGGANGFNLFDPMRVGRETRFPPVLLTGFQLFNKDIDLPYSITETNQVKLTHDQNEFSIEFAALSYINAQKDRYAYRLEGFDTGWITTDGRNRRATYSNIRPGEYTFRVKGSNSDGTWNETGANLKITMSRSFWRTPLAYVLYTLPLLVLLYVGRRLVIGRARARKALAAERQEALRSKELDRKKIRFLANVSNEYRTPLSMVLAPGDKLNTGVTNTDVNDREEGNQLFQFSRNASSLLHLVNQLLDYKKIESHEHKLNVTPGDIALFVRETAYSFVKLAGENNIEFIYRSDIDGLMLMFDHDKLGSILFNLLSNAFKVTPQNGTIQLELYVAERRERDVVLEITLQDTGIGMASGLGITITQEFVDLHGGSMVIASESSGGRCFTVSLPLECQPLLSSDD